MRERMSAHQPLELVPKPPAFESNSVITERHYSPQELSTVWGLSVRTIRELFDNEPGVFRYDARNIGRKRGRYVTMRIPESVAQRVHDRFTHESAVTRAPKPPKKIVTKLNARNRRTPA